MMASTLSPIPSETLSSLGDDSLDIVQSEEKASSAASYDGTSLDASGANRSGKQTNSPKNLFAGGPYVLNDNGSASPAGKAMKNIAALDGALSARISRNEERINIPGPYEEGVEQIVEWQASDLVTGRASRLDSSNATSQTSATSHSRGMDSDRVFDPEGFGDDFDDAPSLVQKHEHAASESVHTEVSATTSVLTNTHPPPPNHAPPPPPPPAASSAALTQKPAPPITVVQTRQRRAQSESSPPTSPLPAGSGFLQPPRQHSATHRRSSPPAPRPELSTSPPPNPSMPRLQQRHTLQVPQAIPAGSLRDLAASAGVDEASGRNASPTVSHRRASINLIRRHSRLVHSDPQLDEIPQDEDAARRAELVKQKLAARRKRKEEEEDDRVLVGTRVDQNHQNWVTAYNMLTGIRFTVSRTNAKIRDLELSAQDFIAKHKYAFDVTGSELTPSAKYDFKFKDYAPQVFKDLRRLFGIDPADYLVSLTSKILLSELASPGKSKSFFYFSRDYKYIIKTVHHAEHKLLRKVLPLYYEHVRQNPNTLLSQFYGLHRIKSTWGAHKTHFVVMNNLFPPHRDIHQTYDLKGSTVGRELKEEDLEKNPRATLKDLNWMRRNQHLAFGPIIKAEFIQQMEKDVALLEKLGIMDYSLLVGIHDLSRGNEEGLRDKTLKVYHPGAKSERNEEQHAREHAPSLSRSPSNAERTRAARELRATLRKEKPVPMNQSGIDMPDQSTADRTSRLFTKDDGGIQSEHENGLPGNEIYYVGIIDCLTKYGLVKRIEHFVKGLKANKNAISAVKPDVYGDRFVAFMKGISKTDEEVDRERQQQEQAEREKPRHSGSFPTTSTRPGRDSTSISLHQPPQSPTDEMTPSQQQAERKARRSNESNAAEEHQRVLTTVRGGPPDGRDQVTLPVLEEIGESSSTGGRSGGASRSRERQASKTRASPSMTADSITARSASRQRSTEREVGAERHSLAAERSSSAMQRQQSGGGLSAHSIPPPTREAPQPPVYGGRPPPTPPKEGVSDLSGLEDIGSRFVVRPPEAS